MDHWTVLKKKNDKQDFDGTEMGVSGPKVLISNFYN